MKLMNAETRHADRDAAVCAAIGEGKKTIEVAKQFKLTASNVRRIARRAKASRPYPLVLTDGITRIVVGTVVTSRGFLHACQFAVRQYSGTFGNLELPQWRIEGSGSECVKVSELYA